MTLSRRSFLKVGALGASLTLSQYLELQAATGNPDLGRSAILVFLMGGPAHQDTFDLKPGAPAEYRGQFRPIKTSVPGIEICEHLPRLARHADRYALIRGVTHSLADHGLGTRYLMTGNLPTPVVNYPLYGSVVSKEFSSRPDIPSFVSIDRPVEGPGYLGAEFGPLSTGEKPQHGHPFRVRGITLDGSLTLEKFNSRKELLGDIDTAFAGFESLDDSVRGLNRFSEQAYQIIASKRSRDAFDLSLEPDREVDRFGRHDYGQSMMLATRLVEAGVRFVTVLLEGWDTHQDNFTQLGRELLPKFDQSLAAMFDRLEESGRLDTTSILVTGEFGRTPKVNNNAGRDHWARAMCSLMAGSSVRTGQVLGATDDKAQGPLHEGFSPDDLAATFFQSIGINPKTEYEANVGRPITLVRDGSVIPNLLT
ncbi:DUF1501 domain-containing protein [Blastopirellula sp. JC732]|uniref:DUF1501 domain-containing protein n=1 Tax=Blastopirellula sediminis TaxID=2894196 RepID=A0A9X1MNB6_9BACT|nr:DUF1501 domain-containing protein [Blastopirellula sediminis]MCC9608599.1 DUF1501 domain-containing protein [Blastopirellula sediminis]MCC9628624.1 DUF1501 domain-containing protein [Blastopirellula sediminis]